MSLNLAFFAIAMSHTCAFISPHPLANGAVDPSRIETLLLKQKDLSVGNWGFGRLGCGPKAPDSSEGLCPMDGKPAAEAHG